MLNTLQRNTFLSISLYGEQFLSYGPIFGKVHRMTPNDLDMSKVKNTNVDARYTPEGQIFVRFTLQQALFELQPNFGKSALNDPKMNLTCFFFKVKNTNMHAAYTPEAHIFVHFALLWAVFELCPLFRKSAPIETKWPRQGQRQKYKYVYTTYTLED